jgi:DNA-directed RNA polymerase specialized sigma24 family protein
VLGKDFARTLRAAQAGEEDAFARLWRDANPAMIRYLRVVGHDDPYDEACEGWITVVRGLPGFAGDELAWRVWLLACARQRAEESTLRRAWGSVTVLPGVQVEGDGEIDIDELLEADEAVDPSHRGINDTLTALRALPLGQGEVVVLHLGAGLPFSAVADVVGVDEVNIERAQTRALERLGTDIDLITWSLAAPPTLAELADEPVALSAFRKVVSRTRPTDRTKVITIGLGSGTSTGLGWGASSRRGSAMGSSSSSSSGSFGPGPSRVVLGEPFMDAPAKRSRRSDSIRGGQAGRRSDVAVLSSATVGTVARRSRTAILTVTALSVSAMSLGGLGAAAYVGVLPDQVQQALHDAVGAPAPKAHGNGSTQNPGSHPVTPPTAGVGPNAAGSPAAGLCRAWAVDKAKGTARDRSVAFRNLAGSAGGADKVEAYCAGVLVPKPSKGSGSPTTGASPTPKTPNPNSPTKTPKTPNPHSPTKAPKTPNANSPTTKAPNPNSPTKGGQPAKGKSAKTSTSTTASGDAGTTTGSHSPNPRSTSKGAKTTSTS